MSNIQLYKCPDNSVLSTSGSSGQPACRTIGFKNQFQQPTNVTAGGANVYAGPVSDEVLDQVQLPESDKTNWAILSVGGLVILALVLAGGYFWGKHEGAKKARGAAASFRRPQQ